MGPLQNSKFLQHQGTRTANLRAPAGPAASPHHGWGAVPAAGPALADTASFDPFRKFAFRSSLGMLFVQVAVLSELLASRLHAHTYLLYFVAPPAILGAAITGGFLRVLKSRAGQIWFAFFCCMALSVPFSTWRGDSIHDLKGYTEFALPFLFTIGGLTLTFSEVRSTFTTIGVAGVLVISAARLFALEDNGRVDMASASGTIGNSNDLASHFIFVLPFLLFIMMDRRRSAAIRFLMIAPVAYAMRTIFGTASRGALIAVTVSFIFTILWAPAKQRVAAIAIAIILAVSIPVFLGGNAAARLGSLFGGEHEEAKESEDSRSYLLKQSLLYTMQHPIFGIGLGQFANYEGEQSVAAGKVGNWHETHNAFTQVSSECGVPAVIFFVLGIGAALVSVNRVYRQARREGYTEIANASFCYLLSLIGFMVSITFLANAFRFYLPVMIGLSIALVAAAKREMAAGQLKEPAGTSGWVGQIPAARPRIAQL